MVEFEMSLCLKVIPEMWPRITHAGAKIVGDDGRVFSLRCCWDLTFTVSEGTHAIVVGNKSAHGRGVIRLTGVEYPFAAIMQGTLLTLGDKLALDGRSVMLPTVFHPRMRSLGLTFSVLALLGLRTHCVVVSNEANTKIALAVVAYLFARSVFVEG